MAAKASLLVFPVVIATPLGMLQFDRMRMALLGPPARHALHRIEGTLAFRGDCRSDRGGKYQRLVIRSDAGHTDLTIPCVITQEDFVRSEQRHVAVLADERLLANEKIYEVDLDASTLLNYDAQVADARRRAAPGLAEYLLMTLVGGAVVLYLSAARRSPREQGQA